MKKYSRTLPFSSRIKERVLLTGSASTKKTYHIVLDTCLWDEQYKVGDSVGILPSNDPKEVALILKAIQASGEEIVHDHRSNQDISIRDFLTVRANLAKVNRSFITLLAENGFSPALLLGLLENKESLAEFINTHTLRETLQYGILTPVEIAKAAMPVLPRFYSIASSSSVFPDEIHLLVSYVSYHSNGKERRGVGSHFLCDLADIGSTKIPMYVQSSNHFTLPEDLASSIIMIGPGTGVAPYRAFMQERVALQATGRHWLFFGERNRETDFYYEPFWTELEKQGRLRLDLAFSRDQNEKAYVQHKMWERRKSLWGWIREGAFLYVCGDAEKMARDVDEVLCKIVKEEGNLSEVDANAFVKKMRHDKRYLIDVY